jgi:nicotinamidase-related amidase
MAPTPNNGILYMHHTNLIQVRAAAAGAIKGPHAENLAMLMSRSRSQLLLIDIQERLAPHVAAGEAITANCRRLALYANRLGVPITLTEHYPGGLGATAEPIRRALGDGATTFAKMTFSAWQDPAIRHQIERLRAAGRSQVIVAGMEAHVCVCQTALDLITVGLDVFLVADAVGSRAPEVRDLALRRLERDGARLVAQEMVAFEWLGRGDTKEFKDLVEVIK